MTRILTLILALAVVPCASADQRVVAVTYFDAHAVDPALEPLGRGVADMLMTDLAMGSDVRVVERSRLNEVLAELQLHRSQFIDEGTAQQLGQGLGATHVVVGSLTAAMDGMRIDARLVEVETGAVVFAAQATGAEQDFFAIEHVVALQLLAMLGSEPIEIPVREDLSLESAVDRSRRIDATDEAYTQRLRALGDYKTRRLVRRSASFTTGNAQSVSTVLTWVVTDGGGQPLSAPGFAERVGDVDMLHRLKRQRRAASVTSLAMLASGCVLTTVGIVSMAQPTRGERHPMGFDATQEPEFIGGVVLLSTGATLMTVSLIVVGDVFSRQAWVHAYYKPEDVDPWIREHNVRIGQEMGLDEDDVLQLDLQQGRRGHGITVRPAVSFAYLGLAGTF
jgi:TolB-like protein